MNKKQLFHLYREESLAGTKLSARNPLAGKLYAEGNRLTPSHASKQGRRYRYYVTHAAEAGPATANRKDVPAGTWRRSRVSGASKRCRLCRQLVVEFGVWRQLRKSPRFALPGDRHASLDTRNPPGLRASSQWWIGRRLRRERMVEGGGFEPPYAEAGRFTVCWN